LGEIIGQSKRRRPGFLLEIRAFPSMCDGERTQVPSPVLRGREKMRSPTVNLHFFEGAAASAFSISCTTLLSSGLVPFANRPIRFPLRSTRNFVKFHSTSPAKSPAVPFSVRNL